jgi:hypothetical protein
MVTAYLPRASDGRHDDIGHEANLIHAEDLADIQAEAGEERDGDPAKGIVLALLLSGVVWGIVAVLVI